MNEYTRITPLPEPKPRKNRTLLLIGGCLTLFLCSICMGLGGIGAGYYIWRSGESTETAVTQSTSDAQSARQTAVAIAAATKESFPTATTPASATPTPAATDTAVPEATNTATAVPLSIQPPDAIQQAPIPPAAAQSLLTLLTANYPSHDYYETATRLGKETLGDRTLNAIPYALGDSRSFYNDTDRITATLMGITDHTYFWVEDGQDYDPADIQAAADRFENEYYERLTNLFGEYWTPGIDNDPRISLLHIRSSSGDELGFFNSDDEYPQSLFRYSNEQELVYLNMDELRLGSDLYFATLVHEVQHLIQWYVDPSESTWLNEGLSQLAEIYLGFDDTAETTDYLNNPTIRLNHWEYDEDLVYAHYAGAYMLSVYLWEQLGDTAVQELVRHPADGMASIHAILQGYAPDLTLEQFMGNWAAANLLDDTSTDPRFHYQNLDFRRPDTAYTAIPSETLEIETELNQYGVHYIDLNELRGPFTLTFAGDTTTDLFNSQPRSGDVVWYVPPINDLNASLTAAFDLSNTDRATLTYAIWYDLEEEYDYAYISISTDNGATWNILEGKYTTRGEHGRAYNGISTDHPDAANGWLKESISLNAYTGQTILLRFDVTTDSGITGQGVALDDIAIAELGYLSTVDENTAGWQANGFIPVSPTIPQHWTVLFVEEGPNPTVTPIPLNEYNQAEWPLNIGKGGGTLIIMPQTPFVDNPATYWLHLAQ